MNCVRKSGRPSPWSAVAERGPLPDGMRTVMLRHPGNLFGRSNDFFQRGYGGLWRGIVMRLTLASRSLLPCSDLWWRGRFVACQTIQKIVRPGIRHDDAAHNDDEQRNRTPRTENVMPVPIECTSAEATAQHDDLF